MSSTGLPPRLEAALARARRELLAARAPEGHWVGELSSSALSTATAVTALALAGQASFSGKPSPAIRAGLDWLARHANADGGWGDTPLSHSNLSTTTLGWAAFGAVAGAEDDYRMVTDQAAQWLTRHAGSTNPDDLAPAIIARYGKDRTFSVPILTMCALAGRLGRGGEAWRHVIPLPFEWAACPHQWFAALRLPVVSYALPALIAIGQARHHHRPSRNPLARLARSLTRRRTLKVLQAIQPTNGGFLEATPLTSFVVMSLAGSGQASHPVTQRGLEFLKASQRPDGSWPIDTNLATWLTTLAVDALQSGTGALPALLEDGRTATDWRPVQQWLLSQQYRVEHPYTRAAPGGWAWTDLPGGVPDADDTSGALLALRALGPRDDAGRAAALAGLRWLLNVQNRDGGIPTFCRGWGALHFDRSSADITAHAIRAWLAWRDEVPPDLGRRLRAALAAGLEFLFRQQRKDGSWVPLWFGNQSAPAEENPTYGTARVLIALAQAGRASSLANATDSGPGRESGRSSEESTTPRPGAAMKPDRLFDALSRGTRWLIEAQHPDGSWGGFKGGDTSVEETALAVEALAGLPGLDGLPGSLSRETVADSVLRGTEWLIARVESGEWTRPAPIGFYFARLWYYERLYPLIFTAGALARAHACFDRIK